MTRKNEAGQALVFGVLALSLLLMGFAGLGIDMGYMRYEKRLQQSAADSAAIAGASNLAYGGVAAAAQNAATTNGFTAASTSTGCPPPAPAAAVGSVSVTVNNPPCSGPHASGTSPANYVEVYVAKRQPVIFMSILGVQPQVVTTRAVATAHGGTVPNGCLYTLGNPSSSIEGVNVNGSATLNAPLCGIVDNGLFNTKGNALTVTAGTFASAGPPYSGSGKVTCVQLPGPCPTPNMPAAPNPMSYLNNTLPSCSPSAPGCTGGNTVDIKGKGNANCGTGCVYTSSNNTYTISPGQYSSITITGVAGDQVVFSSGTYVIDGSSGISIPGNATITGSGVTFYFTGAASINMTGTPSINLTAPSSGMYAGILMFEDPTDTNTGPAPNGPTLGGNSGSTFGGVLYFPKDQLTFYGNSNAPYSAGIVVSDSLALSGNPYVTLEGLAGLPSGLTVIENAVLVE